INVKKGQKVTTKTMIGRQGANGNVTGSHLHFEVRNKNNIAVDPIKYINSKGGEKRVITKLKDDGCRGKATIKRWQQILGTTQDGKISKTSHAIKKWQQFLNKYDGAKLKEDGKEGKATIKATQKFLGTTQDGVISRPSNMVKALQRFLNEYGQ